MRDIILPRFRNGDIKILCNAKVLIEGFDEPKATVALNLHPTFSRVVAEQRGGRVLRLDEENPDKWAYIVDFIDTDSRKLTPITFSEIAQASEASTTYLVDYESKGTIPETRYVERPPLVHLVEIEGLKVVVNAEQILAISASAQEERRIMREYYQVGQAPDGWMTVTDICSHMSVNHKTVKKYTESYRLTDPEWFKYFRSGKAILEYLAPELIAILKETIEVPEAPLGWATASKLSIELHAAIPTLLNIVERYRKIHADWFKRYRSGNRPAEHYSSELVEKLKADLKNEAFVPEGWMTANYIARNEIRTDVPIIKEFADRYRKSNPEWFENYKLQGREVEYYSPDLTALMKNDLAIENKSEGWMSMEAMKKAFNMGTGTIRSFIEKENYRTTNPEWIKKFKIHKVKAECYSPELVKIIKKHFNKK